VTVTWSPEAATDLEEAVRHIALDNPTAAMKVATGILAVIERLSVQRWKVLNIC